MEGACGDPMCNFKGIGTKLWKKKRISSSKQHAFSVVVEVERLFGVDQLTPISFPLWKGRPISSIYLVIEEVRKWHYGLRQMHSVVT